ncbi:MAG: hypothetical protein AAFY59_08220, partial [Pseudomonadota bacterium]
DLETLRNLVAAHGRAIIVGRFDEDYFSTLEDLTLFFIYHHVYNIWVVASVKRTITGTMEELFRTHTSGGRAGLMMVLTNFLVLELDQIQRVFTMFNRNAQSVGKA